MRRRLSEETNPGETRSFPMSDDVSGRERVSREGKELFTNVLLFETNLLFIRVIMKEKKIMCSIKTQSYKLRETSL